MTVEQISGVVQDLAIWLRRTLPEGENIPVSIDGKVVNLKKQDAVRFLEKLSRLMVLSDFKPLNRVIIKKTRELFNTIGLSVRSKAELYTLWLKHNADDYCPFREFETAYLILMEEQRNNEDRTTCDNPRGRRIN